MRHSRPCLYALCLNSFYPPVRPSSPRRFQASREILGLPGVLAGMHGPKTHPRGETQGAPRPDGQTSCSSCPPFRPPFQGIQDLDLALDPKLRTQGQGFYMSHWLASLQLTWPRVLNIPVFSSILSDLEELSSSLCSAPVMESSLHAPFFSSSFITMRGSPLKFTGKLIKRSLCTFEST